MEAGKVLEALIEKFLSNEWYSNWFISVRLNVERNKRKQQTRLFREQKHRLEDLECEGMELLRRSQKHASYTRNSMHIVTASYAVSRNLQG